MFESYANQTIGWRRRIGQKDNGMPLYEDEQPIMGLFEYSRRLIRNTKGDEVVSEARVLTVAKLNPGDMLLWDGREWTAISVSRTTGLGGEELFREVRL